MLIAVNIGFPPIGAGYAHTAWLGVIRHAFQFARSLGEILVYAGFA
jgi:hypothetical protein